MKSILLTIIILLIGCGTIDTGNNKTEEPIITSEPEVFNEIDRPLYTQNVEGDYYLCKPWNYDKDSNKNRTYPLFVYLHGSGSSGKPDILPCFTEKNYSDSERQLYPAIVYLPHGLNIQKIIEQIETIKSEYRVDTSRIYLMGYSMGGSGSYTLANSYYDSKKQLFAGIVRMAGQSQTDLRDEIALNTSVWYHLGLSDTDERVKIGRQCYDFLKNYSANSNATETSTAVTISNYPGVTKTLYKNGIDIVKYTEYDSPVGHGISHFPLKDPYVLRWLFSKRVVK